MSFSSILAASTGYLVICMAQGEDPSQFFSALVHRERDMKLHQVAPTATGVSGPWLWPLFIVGGSGAQADFKAKRPRNTLSAPGN